MNEIQLRDENLKQDILYILESNDEVLLKKLFEYADAVRKKYMGDGIFLRGIVEFSNFCKNTCAYCGLNKNNKKIVRYRLNIDEILDSVKKIIESKIYTIVLQSGEEEDFDIYFLEKIILKIKNLYPEIAITLSIGERTREEYKILKNAGTDRYLLKIETTNKKLYNELHKDMSFENRLNCLKVLHELGYQVGTGNIIGLKNQTLEMIADDLIFFKDGNFDMISISPFIPHQETLLHDIKIADLNLTLKTMALARILTKNSHIPATTALGSMGKDYRIDGLKAGANIVMPNFTPSPYRGYYEIYPNKRCVNDEGTMCKNCLEKMVKSIGRYIESGRGDSFRKKF
jgi:biotin synthase